MKIYNSIMIFLLSLFIRLIPEILAWPYPIGFDTLIYTDIILNGTYLQKNLIELFKSTSLFYIISTAINNIFIGNAILTVKILGPILFAILCYVFYLYSKRVLKWKVWKCFLASLLAGTYFVSLRISWEMYRQMLGLIFLIAILIIFRFQNTKIKLFTISTLGILIVWSHEFIAVLYFMIMAIHFFTYKGAYQKVSIILTIMPAIILFLYQLYSPITGSMRVPIEQVALTSWINLTLFITGFLIYMFLPILPLVLIGVNTLRNVDIWSWITICLIFTYWPLFLPEYSIILWFRWAILLVYPMIFLAIEGFEKVWKFKKRFIFKINIGKILAILILLLNLIMSGYYLLSLPEYQACKYFGEWNNYKQYIQTSMLQNSVSILDTPNLIEALNWVESNIDEENTILVLHEAIHNWARIVARDTKLIRINEIKLSSQIRENISDRLLLIAKENADNGNQVYTIWWINGKGWYEMPNLPSQFKEIKRFRNIAIYIFKS